MQAAEKGWYETIHDEKMVEENDANVEMVNFGMMTNLSASGTYIANSYRVCAIFVYVKKSVLCCTIIRRCRMIYRCALFERKFFACVRGVVLGNKRHFESEFNDL